MIYTLDNQKLLAYLKIQDWKNVWQMLYATLETCKLTPENDMFPLLLATELRDPAQEEKARGFCKLLSQIFLTCFTKPDIPFIDSDYQRFIYLHETLHALLYFAEMKDTSGMLKALLESDPAFSPQTQKKALMLLSLGEKSSMFDDVFARASLPYRASAISAFLGYIKCFTPQTHENKIKLLTYREDLQSLPREAKNLSEIVLPYFRVSYIDSPDKHLIKKDINKLVRDFVKKNKSNIPDAMPRKHTDKAKPVLLVFGEILNNGHAMYRSWGSRLALFREHFHVVLMVMDMKSDDPHVKEMCDEYYALSNQEVHLVLHKIREINPDMIFFLSVGMTMASVLLANHRLAPVQVMALGHPATTYSKHIDYVIGREDYYVPEAFPSDTYIVEDSTIHHTPHEELDKDSLFVPEDCAPKDRIRVMICGMVMKISAPFLQTVREMVSALSVKADVRVITSSKGLDKLMMEDYIRSIIPGAQVFTYPGYTKYFEMLRETDIVLSPFPFGHSHTMIDALLAGKPVLSLLGTEPHSRVEWGILKGFGLADQFVADSRENYKKRFAEMADEILQGKRNFFDPKEIYYKVFEREHDYNYGDLLHWIYNNHKSIKYGKDRLVYPDIVTAKPAKKSAQGL